MKRYVSMGIESTFGVAATASYYAAVRGVGMETPDQRYIIFSGVGRSPSMAVPAPFIPSGGMDLPAELSKIGPLFRALSGNYGSFATEVSGPVTATLTADEPVGETSIAVDSSAGFAAGDFVQFGADFVDAEVHKIASIGGATNITLAEGLIQERASASTLKRIAVTLVATGSGTVSGTETDGSADLDDTDAVFDAALRDGAHRVRVVDDSGNIITGFIGAADPDGDDTRVNIYNSAARTVQNWVEGGATAFSFADTPITYEVFSDAQIPVTTHFFNASQERNPPSLTLRVVKDYNQQTFAGTVVNGMQASLSREFLDLSFDLLAQSDAQATPDADPASSELVMDAYNFADVSSLDYDPEGAGNTLTLKPNMREMTLNVRNGMNEDDGIRFGSIVAQEFVYGGIEATMELTLAFQNRTQLDALLTASQPGKINIVLTRGSTYSLEFQLPRAYMHMIQTPLEDSPMLTTRAAFTAVPATGLDTPFVIVYKTDAYYLYY